MKKLTIAVDLDDTIEDLTGAWIAWLNDKHGTKVRKEDITSWNIGSFFPGLSGDEVYEPLFIDEFWDTVYPKEGAQAFIQKLQQDGHRVFIVTTSHYRNIDAKMSRVISRHFSSIDWENVIVTSDKRMIICDVMVDDAIHNLDKGDYFKILVDMPHNRELDAEKFNMFRAFNLEDAYQAIKVVALMKGEGREWK